ncbi:MAG TPA: Maf family protein [Panacibacter sp.]|nr:Maf family protein [Panacibacter sp.]
MFSKIILASQSPRRKQLLEWAEVDFEIIVQPTDESFPCEMEPRDVAVYIAKHKAEAVFARLNNEHKTLPVLAADTMVVLDKKIIGKPKDRQHAVEILESLSGNKHTVITGVVIMYGNKTISFADSTDVSFHPLTKSQIEFYVDKYKPYDKAGSYAIQEWIGVVGIQSVNGDFYNVMGLPVSRVVQELEKLKR